MTSLNHRVDKGRGKVDRLEADIAAAYQRLLDVAAREAAKRFAARAPIRRSITAAVDPEWTPPDPSELVDTIQIALQANGKTRPLYERALRLMGEAAIGVGFAVGNPFAEQLIDQVAAKAAAIIGGYPDLLTVTIRDAYQQGLSVANAAKLLEARALDASRVTSQLLARTSLNAISNGSSLLAAQTVADAGGEGPRSKTWITAGDERVRETHSEADGQTVPLDQPFDVGGEQLFYPGDPNGSLEETINCFPAGTRVAGTVTAAFRSHYSGSMIQLTTHGGRILAGTPNHPVLTRRGWMPLELVNEDDELICASLDEWSVARAADVDDVPSRIEKVWDALRVTGDLQRVAGAHVNFHGDRPDGDVNVVRADRFLELPGTPPLLQPTKQFDLAVTNGGEAPLALERLRGKLFRGRGLLTSRRVRVGGEMLPLLGSHPRVSNPVRFTDAAMRHGGFTESSSDDSAAHAEVVPDRGFGEPVGVHAADRSGVDLDSSRANLLRTLPEVVPNRLSTNTEFGRDHALRQAGGIEVDHVLRVDAFAFHGEVFTLETLHGCYSANGVIVRNCRCTIVYDAGVAAAAGRPPTDPLQSPGTVDTSPDDTSDGDAPTGLPVQLRDFHLTAAAGEPTRWNATLLVEGDPTEDGRMIADGAASWRGLPLPLGWMDTSGHGVPGPAPIIGRIDQIWKAGPIVQAAGVFNDVSDSFAAECVQKIGDGMVTGVSVDGVADWEIVLTRRDDTDQEEAEEIVEATGAEVVDDPYMDEDVDVLHVATTYTIMGATVCPAGAIARAQISIVAAGEDTDERAHVLTPLQPTRCEVAPDPVAAAGEPIPVDEMLSLLHRSVDALGRGRIDGLQPVVAALSAISETTTSLEKRLARQSERHEAALAAAAGREQTLLGEMAALKTEHEQAISGLRNAIVDGLRDLEATQRAAITAAASADEQLDGIRETITLVAADAARARELAERKPRELLIERDKSGRLAGLRDAG